MIRIGYASGYWGDDPQALERLLENPPSLDYIAMDYLAETTMAVLKRQHENDPSLGYARDFPTHVAGVLEQLMEQDVTLLANAGGVNPEACRDAVFEIAETVDEPVTVAAISGDDILDQIPDFHEQGVTFENMDTGASFENIEDDIVSANAYLGAFPITEALEADPDLVITGRFVDAALVMGPLIHEFDWRADEYDLLASSAVAGHVLECGVQSTGGIFTDWQEVDFDQMGFPIAEFESNGDFVVTKPDNTGGMVTTETVKEQLVYEIKDPSAYPLPDVTVDFTTLSLEQVGEDRVAVTNCSGNEPPESLKVTALYEDGYKAQLLFLYSWPDALEKAQEGKEIVRQRLNNVGVNIEFMADFIGYDGVHPGMAPEPDDPNEIVLRLAVKADEKEPIYEFGKQALPIATGGPPTFIQVESGRPKPKDVLAFWPCTVPKENVSPEVTVDTTNPKVLVEEDD
ncbi:MAG: acyclic terpene utilization AtuA family protein [Halorhabdus sp.]